MFLNDASQARASAVLHATEGTDGTHEAGRQNILKCFSENPFFDTPPGDHFISRIESHRYIHEFLVKEGNPSFHTPALNPLWFTFKSNTPTIPHINSFVMLVIQQFWLQVACCRVHVNPHKLYVFEKPVCKPNKKIDI